MHGIGYIQDNQWYKAYVNVRWQINAVADENLQYEYQNEKQYAP